MFIIFILLENIVSNDLIYYELIVLEIYKIKRCFQIMKNKQQNKYTKQLIEFLEQSINKVKIQLKFRFKKEKAL